MAPQTFSTVRRQNTSDISWLAGHNSFQCEFYEGKLTILVWKVWTRFEDICQAFEQYVSNNKAHNNLTEQLRFDEGLSKLFQGTILTVACLN
jgi:hypothetical protein